MKSMTRGGKREGAGRKPKDIENRVGALSISALTDVFGSEQNAFNHIAEQAKELDGREALAFIKLLIEYAYGKPKDRELEDLTERNALEVWKALPKDEKLKILSNIFRGKEDE